MGGVVEFARRLSDRVLIQCGNRVQLEDANGNPYSALNPVPFTTVPASFISVVAIDQTTPGTTNRVVVGGDTLVISQTPTITAGGIYAAGDALGGLLTFANAGRVAGGSGMIHSVVLIDYDKELASIDLVLFDQTFTATADNAPFDPSDADLANCIGVVPITSGDYASFNDNSVATMRSVGLPYKLVAAGTSLFGQLVVRGTPTYTAVGDITAKIKVFRD